MGNCINSKQARQTDIPKKVVHQTAGYGDANELNVVRSV